MRARLEVVALGALALLLTRSAGAEPLAEVRDAGGLDEVVALEQVEIIENDGVVRGVLVNRTGDVVHEVRLLVTHAWRWTDERRPGTDGPGRVAEHVVSTDIPPGGSARFTYAPATALPRRTDGSFRTSVDVVGVIREPQP